MEENEKDCSCHSPSSVGGEKELRSDCHYAGVRVLEEGKGYICKRTGCENYCTPIPMSVVPRPIDDADWRRISDNYLSCKQPTTPPSKAVEGEKETCGDGKYCSRQGIDKTMLLPTLLRIMQRRK